MPNYETSAAFSPVQRRVIEYAVQMTRTPVEVNDAMFSDLRRFFDDGQIVELTASIAWENYRARFNHALGVPSQDFSEGAVCALAEKAYSNS